MAIGESRLVAGMAGPLRPAIADFIGSGRREIKAKEQQIYGERPAIHQTRADFRPQSRRKQRGRDRGQQTGRSGLAIWTFNDSSGKEKLYRIGFEGRTEATVDLKGAKNRDWEAMCSFKVDDQRFLAVGDVGDNLSKRKDCKVYVMPEPTFDFQVDFHGKLIPKDTKVKPKSFEFTYEDGPHNCEAMGYNSEDKSYWFVEKILVINRQKNQPGIYVLQDPHNPADDSGDEKKKPKNVAKRIADFPVRNVTGMAFSDDNQKLVVRSYFAYFLFEKEEGETWPETIARSKPVAQPLPLQTQGEAICFLPDGNSVLVTSELSNAIIWQVLLDDPQPNSDTEPQTEPAAKE